MELIHREVDHYLESLVPQRPAELRTMENHAREIGFPIIGPTAGYFCYLVTRLTGARKVFELGSGFGYSTAWFASAVRENGGGQVFHVVWDEALSQQAQGHLRSLGYDDLVQYVVGEAVHELAATAGDFDLIFNDIDKPGYPGSLPVITEKLRPGGVLIVDNMLLGGRIFDSRDQSPSATGVRELTRQITRSGDWIVSLVPIRDGLIVARKNDLGL